MLPLRLPPFLAALLGTLALLAVPGLAGAWGFNGHRIIGELAEQALPAPVRAEIRELLADEPSPTLAAISTWADEVRGEEAWRHTGRWHFLNFPRDSCRFSQRRDCPDGNCIVGAIESQLKILGDRGRPRAERTVALKFVVHFIGDLHQPLHAGYADDRGGNDEQIRFGMRGLNLHAFWDSTLLDTRALHWTEYARELGSTALPAPGRMGGRPAVRWAQESCRLIESAQIYPERRRIDRAYVERQRPLAEAQLRLAAARLAMALTETLGED